MKGLIILGANLFVLFVGFLLSKVFKYSKEEELNMVFILLYAVYCVVIAIVSGGYLGSLVF